METDEGSTLNFVRRVQPRQLVDEESASAFDQDNVENRVSVSSLDRKRFLHLTNQ